MIYNRVYIRSKNKCTCDLQSHVHTNFNRVYIRFSTYEFQSRLNTIFVVLTNKKIVCKMRKKSYVLGWSKKIVYSFDRHFGATYDFFVFTYDFFPMRCT